MDVAEILKLLEDHSKEHKERSKCKIAMRSPEGRIAAQIHASVAEELDGLIAEIHQKMAAAALRR